MPRADMLEVEGIVTAIRPGAKFEVNIRVGDEEHTVVCTPSGKLRTNFIKITVGDSVKVEMSPYDTTKGRIIWRNR